jgi:hypothetical protein
MDDPIYGSLTDIGKLNYFLVPLICYIRYLSALGLYFHLSIFFPVLPVLDVLIKVVNFCGAYHWIVFERMLCCDLTLSYLGIYMCGCVLDGPSFFRGTNVFFLPVLTKMCFRLPFLF